MGLYIGEEVSDSNLFCFCFSNFQLLTCEHILLFQKYINTILYVMQSMNNVITHMLDNFTRE